MVFIDYQNFNISMRNYIYSVQEKPFNIDYLNLAQKLNNKNMKPQLTWEMRLWNF